MKKRFMSLVIATIMVFSMLSTTAFAQETLETVLEADDIFLTNSSNIGNYELTPDTDGMLEKSSCNVFINGTPLDNDNSQVPYSADSITNSFSGYIMDQSEFSYVPVTLTENSIIHATLVCPANKNLDYNLSLCTADDDGYLTKIVASELKTYIDPNTGKTVDESLSYIHNQAAPTQLYVVVDSANGSSSTDPFYLTISCDAPGSYDGNEPNDSPSKATPLTLTTTLPIRTSITGSLNVVNDVDWYKITPHADVVFKVSAGDYKAEIYRAVANDTLGLADYTKSYDYYALYEGNTYYVKVYSDADETDFSFGNYTLEMTDQSVYTTMETAYNLGYWRNSHNQGALPWGQSTAFYRFTINSEDKIYARMPIPTDGSVVGMIARDSRGIPITDDVWSDEGGVVTPSIGSPFLPLPIDGSQVSDGIVYLQVAYRNNLSLKYVPSLLTRVRSGYGAFKFSGTCTNPGNSTSNVISLNLTNNSTIPSGCTVTKVSTKGSMNTGVGGVRHMVRPASHDWLTPRGVTAVGEGFYINVPTNIPAKQIWYFKYDQTAFASTRMTNITLNLDWEQDLQFNNYEIN